MFLWGWLPPPPHVGVVRVHIYLFKGLACGRPLGGYFRGGNSRCSFGLMGLVTGPLGDERPGACVGGSGTRGYWTIALPALARNSSRTCLVRKYGGKRDPKSWQRPWGLWHRQSFPFGYDESVNIWPNSSPDNERCHRTLPEACRGHSGSA
jgi:hypothetical protein